MKTPTRFLLVFFLMMAGLLMLDGPARAGSPRTPKIHISYAEFLSEDILVLAGTLTAELQGKDYPELAVSFLRGTYGDFEVPLTGVEWLSVTNEEHQWTAYLDLRNVPDGFYHILIQAELSDGSKVSYLLAGEPGGCSGGICVPDAD